MTEDFALGLLLHSHDEVFTKTVTTRLVCGYLVKVALRFEDLALTIFTLKMELEGGLCLLSRLKKLEHLRLQLSAVANFRNRIWDALAREIFEEQYGRREIF